jgi:hypothetical protein
MAAMRALGLPRSTRKCADPGSHSMNIGTRRIGTMPPT